VKLMDRLAALKLLVVTGKGGVGKSTLAASLGLVLARRGKRTLLLEIDPRESLYQLLDVPPTGGQFEKVLDGLWVQNLSPRDVLDQIVRERLHIEMLAKRLLSSPIYRHFSEAAPGLKEVAALRRRGAGSRSGRARRARDRARCLDARRTLARCGRDPRRPLRSHGW